MVGAWLGCSELLAISVHDRIPARRNMSTGSLLPIDLTYLVFRNPLHEKFGVPPVPGAGPTSASTPDGPGSTPPWHACTFCSFLYCTSHALTAAAPHQRPSRTILSMYQCVPSHSILMLLRKDSASGACEWVLVVPFEGKDA